MGECNYCTVSNTKLKSWCDDWRPPVFPIQADLPRLQETFEDLWNNMTVRNSLQIYAELCPGHIRLPEWTTGETKTPTATTPFRPEPMYEEASTATISPLLIIGLFAILIIAAVIVGVIYYKKKHGRYFLIGKCSCFPMSGVNWTKIRCKYFRRYNSREPETIEMGKESKSEKPTSLCADENVIDSSYENKAFLNSNHNGGPVHKEINVDVIPQTKMTDINRPSILPSVETNAFPMDGKESHNQVHAYVNEQKRMSGHESIPYIDESVQEPTMHMKRRNEQQKLMCHHESIPYIDESVQEPAEHVKRREKRPKYRHPNKVYSSPI